MNNSVAHNEKAAQARVLGRIELKPSAATQVSAESQVEERDFMQALAASPLMSSRVSKECKRVLAEISELQAEKRWDDINALFYPVEEKLPELCAAGMESGVRQEVAFSLGRAGRHEDALRCLMPVVEKEPGNVMAHYTLAYTALDMLYTARTKRQILTHRRRREMIELAHRHFAMAQELRPESVTFFYRQAMLYKEIEDKHRKAVPLFEKAVANWERLSESEKKKRHQQRPKYIRSLYHLASSLLQLEMPARSLQVLERLMAEDRGRDHVSAVFKHFAMGKVLFSLGRSDEALDHLDTAAYRTERGESVDYVHELSARCCLLMGNGSRALEYIIKVPTGRRRPYVEWTHADVLAALGQREDAVKVLERCAERDRRTRHIALVRKARIHYAAGEMESALAAASEAADFCEQTFGNASNESLFWKAAALHGLSRNVEALELLEDLGARRFQYPNFRRLLERVRKSVKKKRHTVKGQNGGAAISLVI